MRKLVWQNIVNECFLKPFFFQETELNEGEDISFALPTLCFIIKHFDSFFVQCYS